MPKDRAAPLAPALGLRDGGRVRARREALLAWMHRHGTVRVAELAEALGFSAITVRRDLSALEQHGFVDRVWGGARARVAVRYRSPHSDRAERAEGAKRAVAAAAAELIAPNMVVGISGGTTLTLLARMLRGRPLNVITNAVNIAAELQGQRATKVIVTGGSLKANAFELVGNAVDAVIRAYHIDLFFCSCSGVDGAGFGRRDHAEPAVVKAFRRAAASTAMVLDRGKLDQPYRARVAALGEVQHVIIDGPLSGEWRARLGAAPTRLTEVGPSDPENP